jgi:hypothetical protein
VDFQKRHSILKFGASLTCLQMSSIVKEQKEKEKKDKDVFDLTFQNAIAEFSLKHLMEFERIRSLQGKKCKQRPQKYPWFEIVKKEFPLLTYYRSESAAKQQCIVWSNKLRKHQLLPSITQQVKNKKIFDRRGKAPAAGWERTEAYAAYLREKVFNHGQFLSYDVVKKNYIFFMNEFHNNLYTNSLQLSGTFGASWYRRFLINYFDNRSVNTSVTFMSPEDVIAHELADMAVTDEEDSQEMSEDDFGGGCENFVGMEEEQISEEDFEKECVSGDGMFCNDETGGDETGGDETGGEEWSEAADDAFENSSVSSTDDEDDRGGLCNFRGGDFVHANGTNNFFARTTQLGSSFASFAVAGSVLESAGVRRWKHTPYANGYRDPQPVIGEDDEDSEVVNGVVDEEESLPSGDTVSDYYDWKCIETSGLDELLSRMSFAIDGGDADDNRMPLSIGTKKRNRVTFAEDDRLLLVSPDCGGAAVSCQDKPPADLSCQDKKPPADSAATTVKSNKKAYSFMEAREEFIAEAVKAGDKWLETSPCVDVVAKKLGGGESLGYLLTKTRVYSTKEGCSGDYVEYTEVHHLVFNGSNEACFTPVCVSTRDNGMIHIGRAEDSWCYSPVFTISNSGNKGLMLEANGLFQLLHHEKFISSLDGKQFLRNNDIWSVAELAGHFCRRETFCFVDILVPQLEMALKMGSARVCYVTDLDEMRVEEKIQRAQMGGAVAQQLRLESMIFNSVRDKFRRDETRLKVGDLVSVDGVRKNSVHMSKLKPVVLSSNKVEPPQPKKCANGPILKMQFEMVKGDISVPRKNEPMCCNFGRICGSYGAFVRCAYTETTTCDIVVTDNTVKNYLCKGLLQVIQKKSGCCLRLRHPRFEDDMVIRLIGRDDKVKRAAAITRDLVLFGRARVSAMADIVESEEK